MTPSVRAWLVLAAGVIAYDLAAPKGHTMSEQVDRWLEKYPLATPFANNVRPMNDQPGDRARPHHRLSAGLPRDADRHEHRR
jgi:hypothetical protein